MLILTTCSNRVATHITRRHIASSSIRYTSNSTSSSSRPSHFSRHRRAGLATGLALAGGIGLTTITLPSLQNDETISTTSSHSHTSTSTTPTPTSSPNHNSTTSLSVSNPSVGLASTPTLSLIRSYLVFTACSIPFIVDNAPSLLYTFTHSPIPFISTLTEAIVRHTFFAQFVAGETVAECRAVMKALRKRGVGAMLNYSAEAEEEQGQSGGAGVKGMEEVERKAQVRKRLESERLEEVYKALDELGKFEETIATEGGERGSTSFALKITGLIDPDIIHRASTTLLRLRATNSAPYPGIPQSNDSRIIISPSSSNGVGKEKQLLSAFVGQGAKEMGVLESDEGLREGDLEEIRKVWANLRSIGERARLNGVKLMIDAEHTWYQPALDAFTLLLSMEFNRPPPTTGSDKSLWSGPLIFGTYQSYLTRQPQLLVHSIKHAQDNGYALGIKLVRGAYVNQERQRWSDEGRPGPDPIWPDKPLTDLAYDNSVRTIISTLSTQLCSPQPNLALSVIFGTHNTESVNLVLETLEKQGLAHRLTDGSGKLRLRDDVKGKVFVAQLFGMKDNLTDSVVERLEPCNLPVALKYIAYGKLSEVMPYLGRRAVENKSVMSGMDGARAERARIVSELWRRYGWGRIAK